MRIWHLSKAGVSLGTRAVLPVLAARMQKVAAAMIRTFKQRLDPYAISTKISRKGSLTNTCAICILFCENNCLSFDLSG